MPPLPASHRSRAPLTRERILEVAVELADEGGLEALTMRRLGNALGVEAMSLYNHVKDKDDILTGIVEAVLAEIDLTPDAADWRSAMRASAISAHDALLRHPWACQLILSPTGPPVAAMRMRYIEAILSRLREAGFSPAEASHGYHALDSHILGFTLWELGHRLPKDAPPDFMQMFVRQLDLGTYPFLVEHVEEHRRQSEGEEVGDFEFGLDLILDGLERFEPASHAILAGSNAPGHSLSSSTRSVSKKPNRR